MTELPQQPLIRIFLEDCKSRNMYRVQKRTGIKTIEELKQKILSGELGKGTHRGIGKKTLYCCYIVCDIDPPKSKRKPYEGKIEHKYHEDGCMVYPGTRIY